MTSICNEISRKGKISAVRESGLVVSWSCGWEQKLAIKGDKGIFLWDWKCNETRFQ